MNRYFILIYRTRDSFGNVVSQVEQAANLTNEGYELVGWFHSHPTFEANPSRTDVATQADMQLQFSTESDRPFIGFILNCIDMGYKLVPIVKIQ